MEIKDAITGGVKRSETLSRFPDVTLNIYKDIQRGKTWKFLTREVAL